MVALQIISKILQTSDISIYKDNQLALEYFVEYPDEMQFILDHCKKWGNVPDIPTFLSTFPEFELVEVTETDEYLVDKIREEDLFRRSVPVMRKISDLLKTDANAAAECMMSAIKYLQPVNAMSPGIDIVSQARKRLETYKKKRDKQDDWFFTTGFPELDDVIHGIQRGEEFFVIIARTNQGKSWILEKICTHIWEIGFNVGYISPEMGDLSIGYRFDTLHKNFSNSDLMWGNDGLDLEAYEQYIQDLEADTSRKKFVVSEPREFDNKLTISKLRKFVQDNGLDVLAIDGITYLADERAERGDSVTTKLTHISEDCMSLSRELGIPVLIVAQVNRSGVSDSEDPPEADTIRDSDGIAYNASIILSIKQNDDNVLTMQIKKQRNSKVGIKLQYQWNPNIGEFNFIASSEGHKKLKSTGGVVEKKKKQEKEDVF